MKSPWQMGLLAVAITGVSTYDIVFFKQYRNKDKASIAIQSGWDRVGTETLSVDPVNETSSPAGFDEYTFMESPPVLSLEELQIQGKQAFIPEDFSTIDNNSAWPSRDPFKAAQRHKTLSENTHRMPLPDNTKNDSASLSPPEPQCTFSGTLIEYNRRLALINGTPRSIGEWLGGWQLAGIGSDYIILEAGNSTRRIELNGISSHAMQRKEPL